MGDVAVIGLGEMGGALAKAFLAAGTTGDRLVSERLPSRAA